MPPTSQEIKDRIQEACAVAKPSISTLAREYRVPYQRLRGRINGQPSLKARKASHKALFDSQEEAVIEWIY